MRASPQLDAAIVEVFTVSRDVCRACEQFSGQRVLLPRRMSRYVFMLTRASRREVPVGFAMFKSMGGPGFELWLAGVDRRYRGRGLCKAMLRAALGTPAGMLAHVARVNRAGTSSDAIVKALEAVGYRHERDSAEVRWFVREDAPQAVVRMVRAGGARVGDG